jgi:hypothetical protein
MHGKIEKSADGSTLKLIINLPSQEYFYYPSVTINLKGLKKEDINFEDGVIYIRRTVMEDMKWFIKKFGIIFVILLVMIVSTGIFYEKNARTSSAEEIWEM